MFRCYEVKTGKKVYEERLGPDAAIYASLVAADGKVFCASEDGTVYVVPLRTSELAVLVP